MAALVAFTLFCMMTARLLGVGALTVENDPIVRADVMTRIAPVGSVRTSADAAEEPVTVAVAQSGEDIVQGVCASCHLAGVAGAPLLDDEAAWAERRPLGLDALTASVVNGKGAMPARAGTDLSDDELRAAVAHMVGLENDTADGAADNGAAESEGDASSEESTDSATAEADTGSTATSTAATAATTTAATTATAVTAASSSDDADAGTVTAQNDGGAEMVAAEASARVKGVVDGICAACHLSGVGGAPKIGDSAAWDARADKGLAAQVAIVIEGQGAMPARGGSDLNDEEIASAIVYLINK